MVDLEDVHIAWLLRLTTKTRNSSALVAHLRRNGKVTPELKTLIANILDGSVLARVKKKSRTSVLSKSFVRGLIAHYKSILQSDDLDTWEPLKNELWQTGYKGGYEKPGDITKAAKFLAARFFQITDSNLNEFLSPRTARKKEVM